MATGSNEHTILVIDDSKVSRSLIKVFLMGRSFTFLEAEDGVGGLLTVQQNFDRGRPIDLVIADMNMPAMDGLTFVRKLKADVRNKLRDLDVVLLTADTSEPLRKEARAAGVCAVVYKPVSSAEKPLIAAIDRALARRR